MYNFLLTGSTISSIYIDIGITYVNRRITTIQTSRNNEMKNRVLETEGKILNGNVQPLDSYSRYNVHRFGAYPVLF